MSAGRHAATTDRLMCRTFALMYGTLAVAVLIASGCSKGRPVLMTDSTRVVGVERPLVDPDTLSALTLYAKSLLLGDNARPMSVSVLGAPDCVVLVNDAGVRALRWYKTDGTSVGLMPYTKVVAAGTQPLAVLLLSDTLALVATDSASATMLVSRGQVVHRLVLAQRPAGVDGSIWVKASDGSLLEFWAASSRFANAGNWPDSVAMAFHYSHDGMAMGRGIGRLPMHADPVARPLLGRGIPFLWHDTVFFASRIGATLEAILPGAEETTSLPVRYRGAGVVFGVGAFAGEAYGTDQLTGAAPISDSTLLVVLSGPESSLSERGGAGALVEVTRTGWLVGRVNVGRAGKVRLTGLREDGGVVAAIVLDQDNKPIGVTVLERPPNACPL